MVDLPSAGLGSANTTSAAGVRRTTRPAVGALAGAAAELLFVGRAQSLTTSTPLFLSDFQ